jgi:uncharacterized membrane protein YciS (DUF1049 family)
MILALLLILIATIYIGVTVGESEDGTKTGLCIFACIVIMLCSIYIGAHGAQP